MTGDVREPLANARRPLPGWRAALLLGLVLLPACEGLRGAEPVDVPPPPEGFLSEQMSFPRVRRAWARKGAVVQSMFESKGLKWPPSSIFLRAFKRDAVLELWAQADDEAFILLKTYPVCWSSGGLGPKRREGDRQVPEGFYNVQVFNPKSRFHLSLGLDYPNASDQVLGLGPRLGGDIFIHGSCVSVGCLPITDAMMEEVYLAAAAAKGAGQKRIPVHVFPTRLDEESVRLLDNEFGSDETLPAFWRQLRPGFEAFEKTRRIPRIAVDARGRYVISQ